MHPQRGLERGTPGAVDNKEAGGGAPQVRQAHPLKLVFAVQVPQHQVQFVIGGPHDLPFDPDAHRRQVLLRILVAHVPRHEARLARGKSAKQADLGLDHRSLPAGAPIGVSRT